MRIESNIMKMYLERESFEIHEASNGQEAYELAMEIIMLAYY